MKTRVESTSNSLSAKLVRYGQEKFTGRLDLKVSTAQQWSFYLSYGRLVWASGSVHPTRRWCRQILYHCPEVNPNRIALKKIEPESCWDYHLMVLLARKRMINPQQTVVVIKGTVAEILFDIFQSLTLVSREKTLIQPSNDSVSSNTIETTVKKPDNFLLNAQLGVRPSIQGILPQTWMLEVEPTIKQVQQVWQQWSEMGLEDVSPDLAPVLLQKSALQQQTSVATYKNLVTLINGKRTLRDIAALIKRDLLLLTRSLNPYIQKQLIELVEVPDLIAPFFVDIPAKADISTQKSQTQKSHKKSDQPLIVCIDDHPQTCKIMKDVIQSAGYRFLGIQDSIKALPLLLKHKPDLIFLDLVMPIVNGYEMCAQIRRVSMFANTPVIILTAKDGIVDRVRARIVGATDFLTKPIDNQKVVAKVRKYHTTSPSKTDPV
ncbi:MAG: response regulator [Moorea sp. SIO3I7]|uniref:response regulator n=1 Tax=Moorena sp. SIO3I8 TaxID=2607833 RepID=UPI0013BF384D|nr:response regulator [Moorena sp. SIO3I8]NEN94878.1 response regulator [Moorena sp. SIO3I7]NEO09471.1 response regulator [Moorena sp. SIO3I8]